MQGYNRVIFLGHIGRSPELRRTPRGTAVCTFSLLVPGESQGEGKGEDVSIDVAVFSALAERCHETLSTGTQVLVEGSLVQRRWQGPGGISQSKYEVIAQVVRGIEH